MSPAETLPALAQKALILSLLVSAPAIAVAALVGLFVAIFQAASQIQDPTIAHVPRLLAVSATLIVCGSWMAHQVANLATDLFALAAS